MIAGTAAQFAATLSEVYTGEHAAACYLDAVALLPHGTGWVLRLSQGDEWAHFGPEGEQLERVELGVDAEVPAEPEPGVYYAGEEHEPEQPGGPTRTMVCQYVPVPDTTPRLSVVDGVATCSCGSTEFHYDESHPSTRGMARNEDGQLRFYGDFEWFDGDGDPGVVCEGCGLAPSFEDDAVTVEIS